MNLINLSRAWISNGKLSFGVGVWAIHGVVALLTVFLLMRRLRVFHRAALAGQEVGILQYRFPDELPQDRHALELAQVFMAVHPERTRDLHLVLQHRFQPRVLRGDEARQDRQRLALQGRVVLRDHARAA
ncbi:hypothetical protein G6F65_021462 [Rhizopus arrhizus]|nr:hypothetical protein G6F65_021462 [Rhizopus arrhizus]